jgi:hypothetical protein
MGIQKLHEEDDESVEQVYKEEEAKSQEQN